ncbi:MAG: PAS domain S-box protein [Acidobacteria bacterium]|nr:PAS domain S-box protein [Acidobacteriota bacterium]
MKLSGDDSPSRVPPPLRAEVIVECLLEAVKDGAFFLLDPEGNIRHWNAGAERLFGYPAAAIIGHPFSELYPAEDHAAPPLQALLQTVLAEGRTALQGWRQRQDGSRFWAEITLVVVREATEALNGFAVIVRDRSASRRVEEALRASENRFRQLVEALPQLAWTSNTGGECDYLSPQWLTYTGIPAAAQLGYGWIAQLHPDDRDRALTDWKHAIETRNIFDSEFRIRRADGVYHWFSTRALPLLDEAGQLVKWFGSCTDIQEQRAMRDTLHQQAARMQLLADASQAFAEVGTDLQSLLERVVRITADAFDAFCAIALRAADDQWFHLNTMYDSDAELRDFIWQHWGAIPHRVDDSEMKRQLFSSGQPILMPTVDLQNLKKLISARSWLALEQLQVSSLIIVPLLLRGQVIGLFYLARHQSGQAAFDENALHLAQDLAERAALAIHNARLYADVQSELAGRRVAEEALRESQSQLHIALESGGLGLWVYDFANENLWWDDSTLKLFGLTREEVADGRLETFIARVHLEDRARVEQVRQAALRDGGMFYDEYRILRLDGQTLWISTRGSVITDATGKPLRMTGACVDISERKRAEMQLRLSEERFSRAFRSSPAAFLITRLEDGRILDVNDKYLALTGYRRDELLGNSTLDLQILNPQERNQIIQRLQKEGGQLREVETTIYARDGEPHAMLLSLEQIELDQEECLLALLFDITDRKRAQEAVQRFVACSPAVIYAINLTEAGFRHTWTSENMLALSGYRVEEAKGLDWWAAHLHPEDRQRVLAAHPFPYEIAHQILEFRFQRKDGSYFWVRDEKRLLRDAQGKAIEIVGSWSDITERVQLEEKLRHSQKMEAIGKLAGGIAHDFNNLLTVIMGYSELLLNDLSTEDPRRHHLQNIQQAGERATTLTRQLLAFSRKQILNPKVLDINEVVGTTEKMLHRLIGENIVLSTSYAPQIGTVKLDPNQLEQVIINLAVNARDAMPEGGRLLIETQDLMLDEAYSQLHPDIQPGRYAMIAISDTGIGMTPEVKAHLFEPFFTTKEVGKGTGLGLATVFGIVKQSGGYLEVYSAIGIGSTFKIYFPILETSVPFPPLGDSDEVPQLGTETILLVEDEEAVRSVAKLILETLGYQVLVASHGREALTIAESFSSTLHLLITDMVMPEMSGSQLAIILQGRQPDLKVLFMSGYIDDTLIREDILAAHQAFLQKPFSPLAFAKKVREVLDKE